MTTSSLSFVFAGKHVIKYIIVHVNLPSFAKDEEILASFGFFWETHDAKK